MSLSLGEWRKLHVIERAMRRSDPHLAALLAVFCRLAAHDAMPGHERLGAQRGWAQAILLLAVAAAATLAAWTAAVLARVHVHARAFRSRHCRRPHGSAPAAPLSTATQRRHSEGHF